MLPAIPKSLGTLPLVFSSALDAVLGNANPLELPMARSAIVILVDGMGKQNLAQRAGHAPFLSRVNVTSKPLRSDFPSTTATSLTGFGTGLRAAEHGIIGYSVLAEDSPETRNMLSGWSESQLPDEWQPNQTIAQRGAHAGVETFFVGAPDYSDSGFTRLVMRGATYLAAKSIVERFAAAKKLVREANRLVYVYVPELDQTAHRLGWESNTWIDQLETLDAEVRSLAGDIGKGNGLIVTADHGVIDVPSDRHIYLDELAVSECFENVAGDPRVNYVYLSDRSLASEVCEALSQGLPDGVYSVTGTNLISSGIFGGQKISTMARIPDIVVLAISKWAIYDRRFAKPQSLKMIGQHGSLNPIELEIPLLRFGAFSA